MGILSVNKDPWYWEWQDFTCSYGQFEGRLVQSVLMEVGFLERKCLISLWITTVKRPYVSWNQNMKANMRSDSGSSRVWVLPEACRESMRSAKWSAQWGLHTGQSARIASPLVIWSVKLSVERRKAAAQVLLVCIFPLWICSKCCTWMSTVLLGVSLVLLCLPPCTYPTHPFLLNLIQGCSFSVACKWDEIMLSEL